MDFIKSYLIVKGEVKDDDLAWLTSAHIPHVANREANLLLVFNINRHYLDLFINSALPSDWEFCAKENFEIPAKYADVFTRVDRQIAENTFAYHAFIRKDKNAGPFFVSSEYEELSSKGFDGTCYANWKARFYLTRGLLTESLANLKSEEVANEYKQLLGIALTETSTSVGKVHPQIYTDVEKVIERLRGRKPENASLSVEDMRVHIYFDAETFFSGWFVDSDERMSYVGGAEDLKPLNIRMNALIKENGLERSINKHKPITECLNQLGLQTPKFDIEKVYPNMDKEIRDYAVAMPNVERRYFIRQMDSNAYGIDEEKNCIVAVNAANRRSFMINNCDYVRFSQTLPTKDEEYGVFFENVRRQIEYNKSLPFMQKLGACAYKGIKLYDHVKGLDASAIEEANIRADNFHRVVSLSSDYKEGVNLIENHIKELLGEGLPLGYSLRASIQLVEGGPVVQELSVAWDMERSRVNIQQERVLLRWFKSHGFWRKMRAATLEGDDLLPFFRMLLEDCEELNEYFEII